MKQIFLENIIFSGFQLSEVLVCCRKSFFDDTDRCHHRMAWLRLVQCAQNLLHWARDSALPPTSLIAAMQLAQLDPAIDLFYPDLSKNIEAILQVCQSVWMICNGFSCNRNKYN